MATKQVVPFSVASIVEDVLQQHGARLNENDSVSRKADETSLRRYEAAGWLRKTAGVVLGKDLPAEPSEEEFRLGLRSGIILCNVINRVQPGAVSKVVEGAYDSDVVPDGAALSAFQYFENIRNFLVAVEELGIPTFENSDLEQGGKSVRVVNCVLALKSYHDWKQSGGTGTWKYMKPPSCGTAKSFVRKNSEPFSKSFSRTSSISSVTSSDQSFFNDLGHDTSESVSEGASRPLSTLVRALLYNRKQEEIPNIVETMLNKVMEEFERRVVSQNEFVKTPTKDAAEDVSVSSPAKDEPMSIPDMALSRTSSDMKVEEEEYSPHVKSEECFLEKANLDGQSIVSKESIVKHKMLVDQQGRHILELKHTLCTTKAGMQFLQRKYQEEFNILGKHLQVLAHAASGYKRVLEENRKLYNQVQDLKGNIRVYCRVRPFLPGQPSRFSTVDHIEEGNITIITPSKYGKEGRKTFTFNKVFGPSATQEEVFTDTQPLIRSVLDGYNVCIFAYGQTGSGKTFTMSGPNELTEESMGVNYRALNDLFLLSDQRKEVHSYEIFVQMLEIYNEQVRDLLATDSLTKRLDIRNSSQNGINVPDACLVPVSSTSDVINLMNVGQGNRAVSATAMNDRSSRSHSCLTVHIQGRDLTSGATIRGSMHLVDLAGSERVDKSEVIGDRLKEAQHINKSLSALGDVISSLASKNAHVPYRNSKLTQLLQDSLGGQAKTLMFVHISPEAEALGETISTLKFAERVATVELGAARVNKENVEVKDLKEQIASLKAALARKDGDDVSSQHSRSSSPERLRPRSGGSSQSSWHGGRRQVAEDHGSLEARSNSSSITRRRSLDPQDLMMNSTSWPPLIVSPVQNGKEEDRESVSGDWVDKIMVNKLDTASRDEASVGSWEGDSTQLPDTFYQNYARDPSKIYPEQTPCNKSKTNRKESHENDAQSRRYEFVSTDDSDELDAGTSDCSEPDLLWQSNLPRISSIPSLVGPKTTPAISLTAPATTTKKTYSKAVRSTEARSMIPSLIPSPSSTRKQSNGITPPMNKVGRQFAPVDGRRRPGSGK